MTNTTTAADTVTAAHVQGLHAFMASEAKVAATDAQLEAAAGTRAEANAMPKSWHCQM